MDKVRLKSVKVVITFENGETESIPVIIPIEDKPFYEFNIQWDKHRKIKEGNVKNIIIHDGRERYPCMSELPVQLQEDVNLILEIPNKIFHAMSTKTNVVDLTFCIDELPDNLEEALAWIFSRSGVHHITINSIRQAYYREDLDERS